MKIENDRQLKDALRELEGMTLLVDDKAPAEDAGLVDLHLPEERRKELKHAIARYRAAKFPGKDE